MIGTFVDDKGKASDIQHNSNEDGRQIITFFLETVAAHEESLSRRGRFAGAATGGPSGVDIGAENMSTGGFTEETVHDVDAKIDEATNMMKDMFLNQSKPWQEQQQQMMAEREQMLRKQQQALNEARQAQHELKRCGSNTKRVCSTNQTLRLGISSRPTIKHSPRRRPKERCRPP